MKDILEGAFESMKKNKFKEFIDDTIEERINNGKLLANKFPELKGLSFTEFMDKLPIELDFITANEMYDELNKQENQHEKGD